MFRPELPLNLTHVTALYQAGLAAIEAGQDQIDLAGVPAIDSTAIAALVGWQRAALKQGKHLQFLNASAPLLSLAELYGVADLLHH